MTTLSDCANLAQSVFSILETDCGPRLGGALVL
jgi:phage baseplate assembly protein W